MSKIKSMSMSKKKPAIFLKLMTLKHLGIELFVIYLGFMGCDLDFIWENDLQNRLYFAAFASLR